MRAVNSGLKRHQPLEDCDKVFSFIEGMFKRGGGQLENMLEMLLCLCGSNNFPQWALQLVILIVHISSSNTDGNVVFLNPVLHGFMVNTKRVSLSVWWFTFSFNRNIEVYSSLLPSHHLFLLHFLLFSLPHFFFPSILTFISLSFFHSVGEANLYVAHAGLELRQSSWLSLLLVGTTILEMWCPAHSNQKSFCLKLRILCFTRIRQKWIHF